MIQFFYSLITFLIALFFIILGIMACLLPWSPYIRIVVIEFLLDNPILLTLFGCTLLSIGILSIFYVVQNLRRRYYTLKKDQLVTDVSEQVIRGYLDSYFHALFPYVEIPCRVTLKKKQALVVADLPYVEPKNQKELLLRIEKELSDIFHDIIGYRNELVISVSFGSEKMK